MLLVKFVLTAAVVHWVRVWNAVTVLCGQLDCDHGHLECDDGHL